MSETDPNIIQLQPKAEPAKSSAPPGTLSEMDIEAFLNLRDWLTSAVEARGATVTGGGVGCGQANIDIKLDGYRFDISIRPQRRNTA